MIEKLKPCPFCDAKAEMLSLGCGGGRFRAAATCSGCGMAGPPATAGNENAARDEAASLYNRRPREERLVKLLREAKGTIEQLRAVQNGCPLPSYEEAFRLANTEADRLVLAIGAELGRET